MEMGDFNYGVIQRNDPPYKMTRESFHYVEGLPWLLFNPFPNDKF